jgi:phosphodiesterase/alkaline phosphatase D-like protein
LKPRIWTFRLPVPVLLLVLVVPSAFAAELKPKPMAVSGPVVFTHGVASGDLRPGRAILWTRVDRAATVRAEVSTDPSFHKGLRHVTTHAMPEHDFTVKVEIDRLDPATSYAYRFQSGASVSEVGSFRTPPAPHDSANVRFAWSSDFDGSPDPPINQFETLDRVREDGVDFFIHLGDTIYADNTPACGSDLDCIRGRYKQNRGYAALRNLMAATGSYAVWDDHEVVDDFAAETVDPAAIASGRKAFEEYMPIRDHTDHSGFYRTLSWGRRRAVLSRRAHLPFGRGRRRVPGRSPSHRAGRRSASRRTAGRSAGRMPRGDRGPGADDARRLPEASLPLGPHHVAGHLEDRRQRSPHGRAAA